MPVVLNTGAFPEKVTLEADFASGVYSSSGIEEKLKNAGDFSDRIKAWFAQNSIKPEILSVCCTGNGNDRQILPSALDFTIAHTPSGRGLLQVFMTTGGEKPANASISLAESLPESDEPVFGVTVNSKIVVSDIVQEFNSKPGDLKLMTIDGVPEMCGIEKADMDDSETPVWFAQTHQPMVYDGTVDFGGLRPAINNHAELGINFVGSQNKGLVIGYFTETGSNIVLDLALAGNFPLIVSGSGGNQTIGLSSEDLSVTATGMAENAVKARLEDFLFNDIRKNMTSFTFDPVTELIQKTISFAGNTPEITEAQLPGDFVAFGTLVQQ